jgi:hypothetical protein
MAADIAPSTWIDGYDSDSGAHTITLNTAENGTPSLPQLTDAKADPTTGDIRQVVLAIAEALYETWLTRGAENQTTQMRMSRAISGDSSGNITYFFQTSITFQPTGIFEIPAEP